jgi:hypothetical protein
MIWWTCNLVSALRRALSTEVIRSRDSSIGIATAYRLDDRRIWNSSPDRVKNCFHVVQTSSGALPASIPAGTGGCSPGCKAVGT